MSKYNLEKVLKKELEVLNKEIDMRIIKGLSYWRQARRHKYIMSSLARIRRETRAGWLSRSFSII